MTLQERLKAILAESEPGCEVCAERRRVAEGSAQFHKDVEEGKRILADSESDQPHSAHDPQPPMSKSRLKRLIAQGALPLGHEFKLDVLGLYPDKCHELVARQLCGQPRSAHEPR